MSAWREIGNLTLSAIAFGFAVWAYGVGDYQGAALSVIIGVSNFEFYLERIIRDER